MSGAGSLRIIGGRWSGRRVRVPLHAKLRPTTDRIRETLFNWLMHDVQDKVCLDLFAGTGALGLEALSRGAAAVTFIDSERSVIQHLHQVFATLELGEEQVQAMRVSLPGGLRPLQWRYDLVFMDPPYRQGLLAPMCRWLQRNNCLRMNAKLYIEAERELQLDFLPETWSVQKQGEAGQVNYYLVTTDEG